MIIPDVNLLIYAHNRADPSHEKALRWWSEVMKGPQMVGVPWTVLFGFIRLITRPSLLLKPLSPEAALTLARSWLERSHVRILEPGPRHLEIVAELFAATGVAGALTTDTHLAALAIEHQAELHSNDGDFSRFPGLRHRNPLR